MNTKSKIEDLVKSLIQGGEEEKIKSRNLLIENIQEAINAPIFYSLPFNEISEIVSKVDFSNKNITKEPISVMETLIERTNELHAKDAVLLLNDIKSNSLP